MITVVAQVQSRAWELLHVTVTALQKNTGYIDNNQLGNSVINVSTVRYDFVRVFLCMYYHIYISHQI